MTILHKIWHIDAEHVSEVHGCYKFQFLKYKMADSHLLENPKFQALVIMQNVSLKQICRPPSWIF